MRYLKESGLGIRFTNKFGYLPGFWEVPDTKNIIFIRKSCLKSSAVPGILLVSRRTSTLKKSGAEVLRGLAYFTYVVSSACVKGGS